VGSTQPGPTHDLAVREAVSSFVRDRVTVRIVGLGLIQVTVRVRAHLAPLIHIAHEAEQVGEVRDGLRGVGSSLGCTGSLANPDPNLNLDPNPSGADRVRREGWREEAREGWREATQAESKGAWLAELSPIARRLARSSHIGSVRLGLGLGLGLGLKG
jgi:hypothetical protein